MKAWIKPMTVLLIAFLCGFIAIVINPSGYEMILMISAIDFLVLGLCLLISVLVKQIKSNVSEYRVFAWTDIVIGLGVITYAVYDIKTATGWFAGLVGGLLLAYVLPAILVFLIVDIIVSRRKKKE